MKSSHRPKSSGAVASESTFYERLLEFGRPLPHAVIDWFKMRGLGIEIVQRFGVAFLEDRKVEATLRKEFGAERLVKAGVLRETPNGDAVFQFRQHPLPFPIHVEGLCRFIQGRSWGE